MFRYIATIPPSNLAISNGSVTIEQNSFILNSDGLPIYYQFHLICTDFADYCNSKNIRGGKNYILLTIHTSGNPITANVLASNFSSFMSQYAQVNQISEFDIQISDQEDCSFSSVKEATTYIRQYFSQKAQNLKTITTIKILSKQNFTWFIFPFTDTQEKTAANNFIMGIKGSPNANSPEFDDFKSLIPHSVILINYRFSLTEPFKFIKHLLKLNVNFENHSMDSQKSKITKSLVPSSPKDTEEDEKMSNRSKEFEFDATWDWKEFIKKKDFKGSIRDMNEKKRIERELAQNHMSSPANLSKTFQPTKKPDRIDKQRLVYVAQKAAVSKNIPVDTMDEILNELDKQLKRSIQFETKASKEYKELGMLYSYYVKKKKKVEKDFEAKRQEYAHVHQEFENKQTIKRDEKIGFDDDVDFTIELLKEEIEAAQKEIEYLKTAFRFNDQNDEEEEVFEEEEEEIIIEEEEEEAENEENHEEAENESNHEEAEETDNNHEEAEETENEDNQENIEIEQEDDDEDLILDINDE